MADEDIWREIGISFNELIKFSHIMTEYTQRGEYLFQNTEDCEFIAKLNIYFKIQNINIFLLHDSTRLQESTKAIRQMATKEISS